MWSIFIIWSYHEYGKKEQDLFSSRFLAYSLRSSIQTSSCSSTTPLRKKTSCNLSILVSLSTTELGPSFLYMDFIPTWHLFLIYTKCKIQVVSKPNSYKVPLFLFRNPRAFQRNVSELITTGFFVIQQTICWRITSNKSGKLRSNNICAFTKLPSKFLRKYIQYLEHPDRQSQDSNIQTL